MFYIFHGEDDHTKQDTLAQLLSRLGDRSMLDLNTTRFAGMAPIASLRQSAETVPFLAPARVVIVSDLFSARPAEAYMEELLRFLPTVPETTRLVFLESQTLRDNHPAIALANREANGLVRHFPLPEGSQIDRWIQQQVKKRGGEISVSAASLLASLVGNNLQLLDNELEKLIAYKAFSADRIIEPADVDLLSAYAAEASIFDLVDALGNRNEKKSSTLYQKKLNEGVDPAYLYSMFVRQFRLLIQVKELVEDGYHVPTIARELRLHDFVAGKLYQQARGFTMDELELIYRHLLEIDVAVKNGNADLRTELDLLVASLTYAA